MASENPFSRYNMAGLGRKISIFKNHEMNLFIASYRFEKNISDIYSAALPFMIVLLVALLVITYVPGLTLLFRS